MQHNVIPNLDFSGIEKFFENLFLPQLPIDQAVELQRLIASFDFASLELLNRLV